MMAAEIFAESATSLAFPAAVDTAALAFYQSHGYRIDKTEDLGEPYMAQGTRLIKTLPEEEGP